MSLVEEPSTIPITTLIEYHKAGFKLVPLTRDSKTPNVNGILTSDEEKRSREESPDGLVHPVNYIYNHPDFWNDQRFEKEKTRFINVATVLGKTHLREQDGRPLYLNALDIDSEQVFTILCRLRGPDGQDIYFIDEMCKNTFVSKTKKKYGRHILWLSHEQYKPIGTRDCKNGTEFEIKTDNSLGLMTLPPSRHRDDSNVRYHSIGQDRIKIVDKMYNELLTILDDCLRPVISKSDSENKYRSHKEQNVQEVGSNPHTEYAEFIIQTIANHLVPFYRKGHRYSIITGFAGLSHKCNLPKEYAGKIIEVLTKNDEERTNRFRILDDTYNKNSKLVSGYNYFLFVLENASGEHRIAVDLLREILTSISGITHQDKEIDRVISLTQNLMEEFEFKTMSDTKELYYYDSDHGMYVPAGECLIEAQLELLSSDSRCMVYVCPVVDENTILSFPKSYIQ